MVDVDDQNTSGRSDGGTTSSGRSSTNSGESCPGQSSSNLNTMESWNKIVDYIKGRKIDSALWFTRFLTITFTVLSILPIFGNSSTYYYKAFMSNAATSALRLHQRLPRVSFTSAFFAQVLLEDSGHYLFYSLVFLYCSPISLALMPIVLFAVLHFASFSLNLLDAVGRNTAWIARVFISLIEFQTVMILRMTAAAEIFTFFFVLVYTLVGRASILAPFVYYRFLFLRYTSRRNHYTRLMFLELRMSLERIAGAQHCPSVISAVIHKLIYYVCMLSPQMPSENRTE